jgi:hypothetical protein
VERRGHRAEIGSEIDRVGRRKQTDDGVKHPRWKEATDVSSQASSRDSADLSADQLDRAHQRIGEQQRPSQAVTELRAGLGIGGNAAGIVVRCARDQSWAQDVAQRWPFPLIDGVVRRRIHDHRLPRGPYPSSQDS